VNIILLISDTFRYDNLFDRAAGGPMGMPVRTPHLDAFAERAVSFSRCYTGSFPTIPHRTDLTSGRFGWPWYGWQSRLNSSKNHAPELLGGAGYATQLLCDCPHLFRNDFDRGFHAALAIRGQESDLVFLRSNRPIPEVMPQTKTRSVEHGCYGRHNLADLHRWTNPFWYREDDRFPPRTAGLAVEWLEENYEHHPFFLWVDWFDPHEPWDPPEYMVRRYDADYDGTPMIHPNYGHAGDYTPEELRNLRAHYCAEAELVDRWVGRVIQKIDDVGLWDNSIVVFTTDHGMSIGEHERTGKSNINDTDERYWPIYPEVARLPLMIAAPGLTGGREVDEFVQPPDILPTLLEVAGVEARPPEPFHGLSFGHMLTEARPKPIRDFAISGSHLPEMGDGAIPPVVYTKQWAYVPVGPEGGEQLFDLAADPYCLTDLAADHADVCRDMRKTLLDWFDGLDAKAAGKSFRT